MEFEWNTERPGARGQAEGAGQSGRVPARRQHGAKELSKQTGSLSLPHLQDAINTASRMEVGAQG